MKRIEPDSRIGLALSGGSVKGFAHVGVLRYLEEVGLRPHIVSGTSAGALVGGLYCDGHSPDEILDILGRMTLSSMTAIRPFGTGGLLETVPMMRYLREHLHHERLEDLPIPLRIVATDMDHGAAHTFDSGELVPIMMASCSIPVIFHPVEIDGVLYVDGGLFRNFPATTIRESCDVLIGMNLGPWEGPEYDHTLVGVGERAWQFVFRQNTLPDKAVCDILLETTDVLGYGMFDSSAAEHLAQVGYETAKEKLSKLIIK